MVSSHAKTKMWYSEAQYSEKYTNSDNNWGLKTIPDNILNLWTLLDFSGKKTNDWNQWTGLLQKFLNIFYSGQSFSACCIYFNLVHQSKNPSVCSMHTHLRRIGATIEDAVDLGPYKVHSDFSAFTSCPEPFFLISLLTWAFISLVCRGGGLEPFTPL